MSACTSSARLFRTFHRQTSVLSHERAFGTRARNNIADNLVGRQRLMWDVISVRLEKSEWTWSDRRTRRVRRISKAFHKTLNSFYLFHVVYAFVLTAVMWYNVANRCFFFVSVHVASSSTPHCFALITSGTRYTWCSSRLRSNRYVEKTTHA